MDIRRAAALSFFYLFEIDLGFENGSGTYTLSPVFFLWPRHVSLVHELEIYKYAVNSMRKGGIWRWFYFKKKEGSFFTRVRTRLVFCTYITERIYI